MRFSQIHPVSGQSMASTFTSPAIDLRTFLAAMIQANYSTTGTLTGTFKLQISADYQVAPTNNNQILNAGTWNDVAGSSQAINVSNSSGSFAWDDVPTSAPWIRVVYTPGDSDTGSLDIWAFTKAGVGT